jgi:predicted XRE-type DNA-binding protein
MMGQEPENATSHRVASLAKKLKSKKYRDSYLSSHTRMFLANQIASLQGEMSQKEFGELLGKPQPIVSRLQNPEYGKYTLQTLLDISSKLDVALIVRFVDYPTFMKFTNDFSDEALRPNKFDPAQLDFLAATPPAFQAQSNVAGEMKPTVVMGHGSFKGSTGNMGPGLQSLTPILYASIGGN